MRKLFLAVLIVTLIGAALLLAAAWPGESAQALPEYSAQTGEPCASCHLSPSGGGQRGPRGQAWVGSGKPGQVPDLIAALELLGVRLEADPADYAAPADSASPAQPLHVVTGETQEIQQKLREYPGN